MLNAAEAVFQICLSLPDGGLTSVRPRRGQYRLHNACGVYKIIVAYFIGFLHIFYPARSPFANAQSPHFLLAWRPLRFSSSFIGGRLSLPLMFFLFFLPFYLFFVDV